MKKTSIISVVVIILASLLLGACDTADILNLSNELNTGSEAAGDSSAIETETAVDEAPVAVDSLNGKTTTQLVTDMLKTFDEMKTFALAMNIVDKTEDVPYVSSTTYRRAANSAYYSEKSTDLFAEAWLVDGYAYSSYKSGDDTHKMKEAYDKLEDNVGHLDGLVLEFKDIFEGVQHVTEKVASAQLYSKGGTYYFEITLEAEKTDDLIDVDTTIKLVFDAKGVIMSLSYRNVETEASYTFSEINKVPEIKAPADADTYENAPQWGDVDLDNAVAENEAHRFYLNAYRTIKSIKNANSCIVTVETSSDGDTTVVEYLANESCEYTYVVSGGTSVEMWILDGKLYVNDGTFERGNAIGSITDKSAVESARESMDGARNVCESIFMMAASGDDFDNNSLTAVSDGYVLEWDTMGIIDHVMTFDRNGVVKSYSMTHYSDGDVSCVEYSFDRINETVDITSPDVR